MSGAPATATLTSPADDEAVSKDLEELAELREMWDAREMTTKEYREMRRTVEARIKKARARIVIRPAVEVLDGIVGPDAAQAWQVRYALHWPPPSTCNPPIRRSFTTPYTPRL